MDDIHCSCSSQKNLSWMLIVAVAVGGAFYLQGKRMESRSPTPGTITVSGDAKVSAKPDIAQLTFGVQTGRQASAKDAMALVSKKMNAILDAVKKEGIEEKDIATDQFYMSPEYDYSNGLQVLRGYQATQSFRVKVRDLDKVGDILNVATNAGANQAGNVDFTIDNPDAAQAQARGEAIADAKAKAKVLAQQLGLSLGKVVSFSEGGGNYMPPMLYSRDSGMGGAMAVEKASPILPGEQDINMTVSITYELE